MAIAIAAAAIGAAGSIVGSYLGGRAGAKAQKEANKIAREQLAFQKQLHAEWEETWGSVEESLANFARTYTPQAAASLGLREVEATFKQLMPQIREANAQRGLTNSGLGLHQEYQANLARHQQRAEVIADSPLKAAEIQNTLFQSGSQHRANILTGRTAASQSAINTLTSARDRADGRGDALAGQLSEHANPHLNVLAKKVRDTYRKYYPRGKTSRLET